jgi:hypothetical protein
VMVYDHALSSHEQHNVERYLAQVYGISIKK